MMPLFLQHLPVGLYPTNVFGSWCIHLNYQFCFSNPTPGNLVAILNIHLNINRHLKIGRCFYCISYLKISYKNMVGGLIIEGQPVVQGWESIFCVKHADCNNETMRPTDSMKPGIYAHLLAAVPYWGKQHCQVSETYLGHHVELNFKNIL